MSFVADVFEMVAIDNITGDVVASNTLQEAGIEVAVQESEIRGGRGNALQAVLHSDRDIKINTKDSHFRYDFMAKQLGQTITTGAGIAYAMPKTYTAVDATGSIKVTLDQVPLSVAGVKAVKPDGTPIAGFTMAAGVITFPTGVVAGDKVNIKTFKYATPAKTETLAFDSAVFAKGMTLILETLEIDKDERPLFRKQYIFDNAIPDGNFSISTAAERAGVAPEFNLRIVKPDDSTVVGRVLRIPLTAE